MTCIKRLCTTPITLLLLLSGATILLRTQEMDTSPLRDSPHSGIGASFANGTPLTKIYKKWSAGYTTGSCCPATMIRGHL